VNNYNPSTFAGYSIKELLNTLRKDFNMAASGEWVPDEDSFQASIEVLDEIEARIESVLKMSPE